jgi:hypothetical protein
MTTATMPDWPKLWELEPALRPEFAHQRPGGKWAVSGLQPFGSTHGDEWTSCEFPLIAALCRDAGRLWLEANCYRLGGYSRLSYAARVVPLDRGPGNRTLMRYAIEGEREAGLGTTWDPIAQAATADEAIRAACAKLLGL